MYLLYLFHIISIMWFGDKDSISDYAMSAMESMVSAGMIQGADGNVNPFGSAARAEAAVLCARLVNLMQL